MQSAFRVSVVNHEGYVSGEYTYRGMELPAVGVLIAVEQAAPGPQTHSNRIRARVMRSVKDADPPIIASRER